MRLQVVRHALELWSSRPLKTKTVVLNKSFKHRLVKKENALAMSGGQVLGQTMNAVCGVSVQMGLTSQEGAFWKTGPQPSGIATPPAQNPSPTVLRAESVDVIKDMLK